MEKKTTEEIGEVLEAVWTLQKQKAATVENVIENAKATVSKEFLKELESEGLLEADDSGHIKLLPEGLRLAEQIIRRHRLAERLLCDVLGYHVDDSEAAACEYEHVLAEGITNSILTTSRYRKESAAEEPAATWNRSSFPAIVFRSGNPRALPTSPHGSIPAS